MHITKGVIAAAGRGTRFLPSTKAVPKELLPIVDKPIIQYLVEEFISAGIKNIVIVTASERSPIRDHFRRSVVLERHLRNTGKPGLAKKIREIADNVDITFIKQNGPYGNGTPCLNAAKLIGHEPFVYAFGDDLVLSKKSFTKQMLDAYKKKPGLYAGAQEVAKHEAHKYGIIKPSKHGQPREMSGIIEKPAAHRAPSNLANIGRFILPPEIFPILARKKLGTGNELWLIDAIDELVRQGCKAFYKKIEQGRWYTTGDPVNYLEAVRAFALASADYKNKVRHIFTTKY